MSFQPFFYFSYLCNQYPLSSTSLYGFLELDMPRTLEKGTLESIRRTFFLSDKHDF